MMRRSVSRARRTFGGVAAALAALAIVIGGGAAPASAAAGDILVSADGVTYTQNLASPLFSGIGLIVPGDTVTASVWIKNNTSTTNLLRVTAANIVVSSAGYASALTVVGSSAPGTTTTTATIAQLQSGCPAIIPMRQVLAGGVIKVTVALTFDAATSGTLLQNETADLDLKAAMWQDPTLVPANACDDVGVPLSLTTLAFEGPTSGMAFTGGGSAELPLAIAAGLLGVGLFLIVARRRKRSSDEESA
jgi:hypothetical protein